MNKFRNSLNSELKNIQVSEKLKNKTLKRCKKINSNTTKNLKVITATAASVAILVISLAYYINFNKEPSDDYVENDIKKSDVNKNVVISSDTIDEDKSSSNKNEDKIIINDSNKGVENKISDKAEISSEQASVDINLNNLNNSNIKEKDSKKVVSNSSEAKTENINKTNPNSDESINKNTEKENKNNAVAASANIDKKPEFKRSLATTAEMPLIGVSEVQGTIKNTYKEKDFLFLEVQNLKGEIELFYAENNSDWESKFKNLKIDDKVNIKYALGTPKKYKDKMAMPLNDINLLLEEK